VSVPLSVGALANVEMLARDHGTSEAAVLLGAWAVLLCRLSDTTRAMVGVISDGRRSPELADVPGLFARQVPVSFDVDSAMSFTDLLSIVHRQTEDASRWQEYYDEAHGTPLPFAFEHDDREVMFTAAGLRWLVASVSADLHSYTLKLSRICDGGRPHLAIAYDRRWFAHDRIVRCAAQFATLLDSVVAHPREAVGQQRLLSAAELHRIVYDWNATETLDEASSCVHEIIEQVAARAPDAIALTGSAGDVRYGELNQRANQLAWHLRRRGAGPDMRVAVFIERSVDAVIAVLGILKAGAAYVSLEAGWPIARVRQIVGDAGATLTITRGSLGDRLAHHVDGARIVRLDADAAAIGLESTANPPCTALPESLAYVLYTSGSTGRPKGVMVSHAALANYLRWCTAAYECGRVGDSVVHSSLSFDLTVTSVFSPLLVGRRAVLVEDGDELAGLARAVRTHRAGLVKLTPSHLRALEHLEGFEPADWTHCTLVIGGEALHGDTLGAWQSCPGGPRLINEYGPTETVVGCCVYEVAGGERIAGAVPIGRPVANTRLYVLDAWGQPLPVGMIGELFIGGAGVARGYLGNPGLTAERFVPDPFGPRRGARLYRTGDRARYREDRTLEFLGRTDHQVKVRGFRIELGEIEAALIACDGVRQAVVLARQNAPGDQRLAAYVVAPGVSADTLRAALTQTLPEYMVPAAFVLLERLPLTPNAKVDRAALPRPEDATPEDVYVAPRNDTERILAELWSTVLRRPRVSVDANYFELGGDSILSIQIVARANRAGLRLTPAQVFSHPTIAQLARVAGRGGAAPVAEQQAVSGEVILTPIQRWFFAATPAEPHHVNQAVLLRARDRVNASWLREAVEALVRHHDALRSRFERSTDGRWRQWVVAREEAAIVEIVDVGDVPDLPARIEEEATRVQRSLDLGRGPLMRVCLLRGTDADRLFVVIHHLVVDGVSWRVLLEDLQRAYARRSRGEPVALGSKTASFRQWAAGLEAYANSADVAAEAAYWAAQVREADGEGAGEGFGGAGDPHESSRTLDVKLPTTETQALLTDVPSVYGTQITEVLLTALGQSLRAWSGRDRFHVDLEAHGREEVLPAVDLSRTAGWFTSIHPVVLAVDDRRDLGTTLKRVKEQLRRMPRRGIGYGLLRYMRTAVASEELPVLSPAPVSFNYLGQVDRPAGDADLFELTAGPVGPSISPRNARRHDLNINTMVSGGELCVSIGYSAQAHTPDAIERLGAAFLQALRAILDHCRMPGAGGHTPSDFPLAALQQPRLDHLRGVYGAMQDIYPLSPLQQGMLFHTVYEAAAEEYFEQVSCRVRGPIDPEAFETAWHGAVDRHGVLRTAFVWDDLAEPLQVVLPRASLDMEWQDWRGLGAGERPARLRRYLAEIRARGFDFRRAPLMRLSVVRVGDEEHFLVWNRHHLLLDAWSTQLLLREVFERYAALRTGTAMTWPAVRPYRDYIAWQLRQGAGAAERYWREQLRSYEGAPGIGIERSRSSDGDTGYEDHRQVLAPALGQRLREFARRHRITLSTVMQGAWALLLHRYSGRDDIVFGTVTSGRPGDLPDVESMVGMFINTLPLRVHVNPAETVQAWLERLHDRQAQMREHEHSSLIRIQGWSDVPRGVPLFDSILAFENYPSDPGMAKASDLQFSDFSHLDARTGYPLLVGIEPPRDAPGSPNVVVKITHARRAFDSESIERLLNHYLRILEGLIADPRAALRDVPMLTAAERTELAGWNDTTRTLEGERCMHEMVEGHAERIPDAVALSGDGFHLTYRALNARANRIARVLHERGVGPDARVAICLERSPDLIAGLIGIMKAGGAWLPLDPGYPPERLAFMIEDARAAVVVTESRFADRLGPTSAQVLLVDVERTRIEDQRGENLAAVNEGSLAYVIYTSGTTGQPKAALNVHRGVCNQMRSMQQVLRVGPDDRLLQKSPFSFDMSCWETFFTLCNGSHLVLARHGTQADPAYLAETVEREQITDIFFVPAMLQAFMRESWIERCRSLKRLFVAGEVLSPDLQQQFFARSAAQLHNLYGPTEASCCVTHWQCQRDAAHNRVAVGTPFANTQIHILDGDMQSVPPGVAGELYIGGIGLGRGYLNHPDLTAERFLPNPFAQTPGERFYRTGDSARRRLDGVVEVLGRLDHQIKLRGYRIELGEIEAALLACDGVREAVVLARQDVPGDVRLVGYVVTASGQERDEEIGQALRRQLAARLPEYMVPAAIVTLEALPVSAHGKLDRKALPSPDFAAGAASRPGPRTPTEDVLTGLLSELLQVPSVALDDSFFDLGGHSLVAIQLISDVRKAFGIDLQLSAIFEHRTVRALAEQIDAAIAERSGLVTPPLARVDRGGELPLSFAQQRLWFLNQLEPGNPFYNVAAALLLSGRLRASMLGAALSEVVRRHEVLRTTFTEREGRPVPAIEAPGPIALPVVDLQGLDDAARETEQRRLARSEARVPFDLGCGPLLRARLLRLGPQQHVLLLALHHIAADGWSMGVLGRELAALYGALAEGRPSPLPDPHVQYADFAAWQRRCLDGEMFDRHIDYWRRQLAATPQTLQLPTDRERPRRTSYEGRGDAFRLPAALAESLRALSRREGVTLFMTLLTAFKVLLQRQTGADHIPIGASVTGRTAESLDALIGCFINTVVLRTDLSGDPSFRDALSRVREVTLGAFTHQQLPFDRLVEVLQPPREPGRTPFFDALFGLETITAPTIEVPDLTIAPIELPREEARFDVTLMMNDERDGGISGLWTYRTDLFERRTFERATGQFIALLESAVADPDTPVGALALVSANQQQVAAARERHLEESMAEGLLRATRKGAVRHAASATSIDAQGERA
jgi:amino acid adenylation domain-containing protein/non-ribosomal peptide synthase protein (TIGR01720 family)